LDRERGYCNHSVANAYATTAATAATTENTDNTENGDSGGGGGEEDDSDGGAMTPLTSSSRLALSGKLMGYAALGKADAELVEAIRTELKGCPVYATMMTPDGRLDDTHNQQRCQEMYGTGHGPGGQLFLDTPNVVAKAKELKELKKLKKKGSSFLSTSDGDGNGLRTARGGGPLVSRAEQRMVAASAQVKERTSVRWRISFRW
jgi:hypothetical protein